MKAPHDFDPMIRRIYLLADPYMSYSFVIFDTVSGIPEVLHGPKSDTDGIEIEVEEESRDLRITITITPEHISPLTVVACGL